MERHYFVSEKDLPVSCPLPETARWNSHPRVYLPLKPGVDATCPLLRGCVLAVLRGSGQSGLKISARQRPGALDHFDHAADSDFVHRVAGAQAAAEAHLIDSFPQRFPHRPSGSGSR